MSKTRTTLSVKEYQAQKTKESQLEIAAVLSDGKRHQYSELVKEVKISNKTLSKQLKKLEESGKVIRSIDKSKYPNPVYYQSLEQNELALFLSTQHKILSDAVEKAKNGTVGDSISYINSMNESNFLNLLVLAKGIKETGKEGELGRIKDLNEKVTIWVNSLLVSQYKEFVWGYIKIINPSIKEVT